MYELLLRKTKHKGLMLFSISFFSVIVSTLLSRNSGELGGLLVITLSIIPLIQIMSKLIEIEEIKEEKLYSNILVRHASFIKHYFSIFLGSSIGFYISATMFPEMFKLQVANIYDIWREFSATSMFYDKELAFFKILTNNLKVLIMSFLLSFIFGAGAIYIILWNASILGTYLYLSTIEYSDRGFVIQYILGPMYDLIKLAPHGIPEFISFFLAALSGGILSVAVIKVINKAVLFRILEDSILIFVLSIVTLVLAAFIEVYF